MAYPSFDVGCYRYNHKLMKLAEAVLREVADFKVEADRFQVSRSSLLGCFPWLTFPKPFSCCARAVILALLEIAGLSALPILTSLRV